MSIEDKDWLLFDEARHDLVMEAEGTPAPVGKMQRQFPSAYQAAREFALCLAGRIPLLALSIKQAERISEMIHSEDEGLNSIQDVLNMQPVNVLTLTALVRLERARNAKTERRRGTINPVVHGKSKKRCAQYGLRETSTAVTFAPKRNVTSWVCPFLLPERHYGIPRTRLAAASRG